MARRLEMTFGRMVLVALVITAWSCRAPVAGPPHGGDADVADDAHGDDADVEGVDSGPDADADSGAPEGGLDPLALTGLLPNHGPFTGGTEVTLRGRGFTDGLTVHFGDHLVDPVDVELVDDNRISVVTPAGNPGAVDVTITTADDDEVSLADGYTYDGWYIDPASGSVAGGTLVRLVGMRADFPEDGEITFDGAEATDVTWISSDEMTCRTPAGMVGAADVVVGSGDDALVLYGGFTYFDSSDPRNGGLGGGPIEGTIDVTVLEGIARTPLPDSFVILGTDAETTFRGRTDAAGRITFSDPDLSGRQTITAGHAPIDVYDEEGELLGQTLFESTTITEFDARSVTILLEPIPPPQPGAPPPGRRGGYIEGELLFEHQGEFGPYEWAIVPEPEDDEIKVAFVYTTQSSVRSSRIEPGAEGKVLNTPEYIGINGYRFRIYAAPGTVAVYAFAGLARVSNPDEPLNTIIDFVPYAMGLTRGVVVGPDETVRGINVLMTRQMSETVEVELQNAPVADDSGTPNTYIVDVYLDVGAEGFISRPETQLRASNPFVPFDFPGWVDLSGNLAEASYTIVAGAWTTRGGSDEEQNPYSVVYRAGVTEISSPVVIDEFLAVPRAQSPRPGAVVEDRRMSWTAEGENTPDFSVATLTVPSGVVPVPFWMVVLRGGETSYELPDLAAMMEEMPEDPRSDLNWQVWSFSVDEGFDYDSWSYRYLYSRYWSAYAVDSWYIRLRE